jgi:hypothetical protein
MDILTNRPTENIRFDPALQGFWRIQSTVTAIIEAKLKLDIASATGGTLYQIFLEVSKAYDKVNRQKLLEILTV